MRNYLKIAFLRSRSKNTKTTISIACIAIAILMLMISNMMGTSIEKYSKGVQASSNAREVSIEYNREEHSYEEMVGKIQSLNNEHITMINEENGNAIAVECEEITKELEKKISLCGVNKKELEALGIDSRFSREDAYEIILPKQMEYTVMTDEYDEENLRYLWKTYIIDCTQFEGREITINVNENSYRLKVIGIYNSEVLKSQCGYVPIRLQEMLTIQNVKEEVSDEKNYAWINGVKVETNNENLYSKIIITVDSVTEAESLEKQLRELAFELAGIDMQEMGITNDKSWEEITANPSEQTKKYIENNPEKIEKLHFPQKSDDIYTIMGITEQSVKTFNLVKVLLNVIGWIILIVTILLFNTKNIYEKSIEYGTLKTQGYTNKEIQIIGIIECVLTIIFSMIIAIILYGLVNLGITHILNIILDENNIDNLELQESIGGFLDMPRNLNGASILRDNLIIIVFVIILSFITNQLMLKRSIKDLIEEKESVNWIDLMPGARYKKVIIYIISIIVLFLVVMTISNVNHYVRIYYTDMIERMSDETYEGDKEYSQESGVDILLDIPKEKYSDVIRISGNWGNAIYSWQGIQVLKRIPGVEETYRKEIVIDGKYHGESYFLILDKWENTTLVKSLAKTYNFHVESYVKGIDEHINTYNVITIILNIAQFIILIMIITIFMFYVSRMIEEDRENIGILKSVGYSNFKILQKVICKILLIIVIAYVLNYLVLIGVNQLIDNVLYQYGFANYYNIVKESYNFNILIIFLMTALIVSWYSMRRLKKMNTIDILK